MDSFGLIVELQVRLYEAPGSLPSSGIMKEEGIQGFAECVVAQSWSEGVQLVSGCSGFGLPA